MILMMILIFCNKIKYLNNFVLLIIISAKFKFDSLVMHSHFAIFNFESYAEKSQLS